MRWLRFAALTVLALVVLAVAALWLAGFRAGAGTIDSSVEIDRSPEVVWPWLQDPDKLKAWVSWLTAVEADAATPPGVGYRTVWTMHDQYNKDGAMRIASTATEWNPPHRLAVHIASPGAFSGDARYTLEPLPGGRTRLRCQSRYRFDLWLARLFEPLVMKQAEEKFTGDMARLKTRVEAAPTTVLSAAAR